MRQVLMIAFVSILVLTAVPAFAYKKSGYGYTKDTYGHWETNSNAYKDSDGDGVVNHYDSNNNDASRW